MKKSIGIALLYLWIGSCVEPYDINTSENSLRILVVDAILTDEDIDQKIKISEVINERGVVYNSALPNLKVDILVNQTEKISLTSQGQGVFALPKTFRTKANNTYKLIFEKADGTRFESTEQRMPEPSKIDKIYDEFVIEGIGNGVRNFPANYIYIDFKDPANENNYYVWSWTLWEKQYICRTGNELDYYCNRDCWEILYNEDLEIFSDVYSNGKEVAGKVVAKIPYYQDIGALFEVKQQVVTAEAYRFLKLLNEQTKNTGTLVDTPPAAILGNVRNLRTNEPTAGFFIVASTELKQYWLDRKNAIGKAPPIGLLGRRPITDPNAPLSPCVASRTRTPAKPRGWVD